VGKMRKELEMGGDPLFGVLGSSSKSVELRVANDRGPTLCTVIVSCPQDPHRTLVLEASLGQLRALVTEAARAFNILADLQQLQVRKIKVDGKEEG